MMRRKAMRKKRRINIALLLILLVACGYIYAYNQGFPIGERMLSARCDQESGCDWKLILVNPEHKIARNLDIEFTELWNGQKVDSRIYADLQQMFDDMRSQGIYPMVVSGYRSAARQKQLMQEKIADCRAQGQTKADAKKEALNWVAEVGYSEHQTGLAVDINADGVSSTGNQVYAWLAEHAWEYGFILRYPEDKKDITQTEYEPWHYRYVGQEAAAEIYWNGLCLEEYLSRRE